MKYPKLFVIGALLLSACSAKAGNSFGGSWKPNPNFTLFGQKITWALPSLCIGAKAGVLPDAGISSDGINFKVPYFSLDLPFPVLTIKTKGSTTDVKIGSIEKSERKEGK